MSVRISSTGRRVRHLARVAMIAGCLLGTVGLVASTAAAYVRRTNLLNGRVVPRPNQAGPECLERGAGENGVKNGCSTTMTIDFPLEQDGTGATVAVVAGTSLQVTCQLFAFNRELTSSYSSGSEPIGQFGYIDGYGKATGEFRVAGSFGAGILYLTCNLPPGTEITNMRHWN